METKKCTKCQNKFPATLGYWHKQSKGKYGLRAICKRCSCEYNRISRNTDANREKHRLSMKEWRENNHDKALEISRKAYNKSKDEINKKRRELYHTNPEYKIKRLEAEKRYVASGRRHEINEKPEQREKTRLRNRKRRLSTELRKHDYERGSVYRKIHANYLNEMHRKRRAELTDSYVACSMRLSVNDVNKETIETRRLIIKLKRELKKLNVKIR